MSEDYRDFLLRRERELSEGSRPWAPPGPPEYLRLRVISDGTKEGTYVEDADTGRRLWGITRITWDTDWTTEPQITLHLEHMGLEFVGDAQARWDKRIGELQTEGDTHVG